MDSGPAPRGASRNDELPYIERSQKFLGLFARCKTANLAIVGIVLGRIRRTNSDKLAAVALDNLGQVLAIEWRHMPCATVRAIVVARGGPLVEPYAPATGASVKIQKPG